MGPGIAPTLAACCVVHLLSCPWPLSLERLGLHWRLCQLLGQKLGRKKRLRVVLLVEAVVCAEEVADVLVEVEVMRAVVVPAVVAAQKMVLMAAAQSSHPQLQLPLAARARPRQANQVLCAVEQLLGRAVGLPAPLVPLGAKAVLPVDRHPAVALPLGPPLGQPALPLVALSCGLAAHLVLDARLGAIPPLNE